MTRQGVRFAKLGQVDGGARFFFFFTFRRSGIKRRFAGVCIVLVPHRVRGKEDEQVLRGAWDAFMAVATGAIQVACRFFFRLFQRLTFVERFVGFLRKSTDEHFTILVNGVLAQVSVRLSVLVHELEFFSFQRVR